MSVANKRLSCKVVLMKEGSNVCRLFVCDIKQRTEERERATNKGYHHRTRRRNNNESSCGNLERRRECGCIVQDEGEASPAPSARGFPNEGLPSVCQSVSRESLGGGASLGVRVRASHDLLRNTICFPHWGAHSTHSHCRYRSRPKILNTFPSRQAVLSTHPASFKEISSVGFFKKKEIQIPIKVILIYFKLVFLAKQYYYFILR